MNHLAHGGWEAGPGFVTGCQKPVIVLDKFTNWNPFPDERNGIRSSVSSYERVNKVPKYNMGIRTIEYVFAGILCWMRRQ